MNDTSFIQLASNPSNQTAKKTKLLFIAVIILSLIVIVESIILVVLLTKPQSSQLESTDDEAVTEEYIEPDYTYDDNKNLIAISFTCSSNEKVYTFSANNEVMIYGPNKEWLSSGEYEFVDKDTIRIMTDEGEPPIVLDFKDDVLSDNVNTYTCKSNSTNEDANKK